MEHMPVIVRNTFIEFQQPADPGSARRATSLPHFWRFRDHVDILIGACTRLANTNIDDLTEVSHINSQSASISSISTVSAAASSQSSEPTQKPTVSAEPVPFRTKRINSSTQGDVLGLCIEKQASLHIEASRTQVSTKGSMTVTRWLDHDSRSRSVSSSRSGCSANSHGTGSTICDSGGLGSRTVSSSGSFVSVDGPGNAGRDDGVQSLPQPNLLLAAPEVSTYVSASRRSRRRRAAARKAAEQAEQGQLRVHAPIFQPQTQSASALATDMFDMLSAAQALILGCPHILSAQIIKPESYHTTATNIVISYHAGKAWEHDVRTLAKNAFFEAASKSEQVYILGHGLDSYTHESDCGFVATIGSVPVDRQHATCWDFWQKGFCQRLSTCRWCHPSSSDLMSVNFVFEPAHLPVQHLQYYWSS